MEEQKFGKEIGRKGREKNNLIIKTDIVFLQAEAPSGGAKRRRQAEAPSGGAKRRRQAEAQVFPFLAYCKMLLKKLPDGSKSMIGIKWKKKKEKLVKCLQNIS